MTDKNQQVGFLGPLAMEIEEFIDFKRQSGSVYRSSEYALKAFDRFCVTEKNQGMSPQQLAEAWMQPSDDKPRYDDGCSVSQLGQYLTETGNSKAFTVLSVKGNAPKLLGVNSGPFVDEIKGFVDHKRASGRKYTVARYGLRAFDIFCAMKENELLNPQQLADAWYEKAREKNGADLSAVREFGLHLTTHGSAKSFLIPYANGDMPKPAFNGYTSLFAAEIESFLTMKRSIGLKYRQEEFLLKDFDRFCIRQPKLSPQQLADTFIHSREEIGYYMGRRSVSVIREFGKYLTDNCYSNAFTIVDKNHVVGPYAEEVSTFVSFKKSCGFKYLHTGYCLRCFDAFCASRENETLAPQQLADKWALKREDEHSNTRAGRVGPVRVFGKYLTSIGHPKAFTIADDVAPGKAPEPPYLFSEDEIELFFGACARLRLDEKEPSIHIVLPAAFLFMHCMGVRTSELTILMENVNFDTGEVILVDAKTGDRAVHMSKELSEFLFNYNLVVERCFPHHKYLFPASVSRSRNDFAKRFREIWAACVPATKPKMPRLYDFRHHFLYRNVELCMSNGGDVNVMRLYIMRHMGHKMPESFQYYFHLSPPIRKEVSKIKNDLDWMIPDAPEVPYE